LKPKYVPGVCGPSRRSFQCYLLGQSPTSSGNASTRVSGELRGSPLRGYDGTDWSAPGSVLDDDHYGAAASALEVLDDGDGTDLQVGGEFEPTRGLAVHTIAKRGCTSADIDGDVDADQADLRILLGQWS
jgi:hypothetical protein